MKKLRLTKIPLVIQTWNRKTLRLIKPEAIIAYALRYGFEDTTDSIVADKVVQLERNGRHYFEVSVKKPPYEDGYTLYPYAIRALARHRRKTELAIFIELLKESGVEVAL